MTSGEEARPLVRLSEILDAADPDSATPEQLADAVKRLRLIEDNRDELETLLLAALHRRTKSWPEVGRMTDTPTATAHRRGTQTPRPATA